MPVRLSVRHKIISALKLFKTFLWNFIQIQSIVTWQSYFFFIHFGVMLFSALLIAVVSQHPVHCINWKPLDDMLMKLSSNINLIRSRAERSSWYYFFPSFLFLSFFLVFELHAFEHHLQNYTIILFSKLLQICQRMSCLRNCVNNWSMMSISTNGHYSSP